MKPTKAEMVVRAVVIARVDCQYQRLGLRRHHMKRVYREALAKELASIASRRQSLRTSAIEVK